MATAYRHMGPGSTKQLVHYARQRLGELKELMEKSESQGEMLRTWVDRQDLPQAFVAYAGKRIVKLFERRRTDNLERGMWQELLDALPLCGTCDGYGETQYQDHDDAVRSRTCGDCGGTGEKK